MVSDTSQEILLLLDTKLLALVPETMSVTSRSYTYRTISENEEGHISMMKLSTIYAVDSTVDAHGGSPIAEQILKHGIMSGICTVLQVQCELRLPLPQRRETVLSAFRCYLGANETDYRGRD